VNRLSLPHHADIGIGGIAMRLHTESHEFVRMLDDRYAGFLSPVAEAEHEFDVTLLAEGTVGREEDVSVEREGSRWSIRRGDFRAEWDADQSRGWIRQTANPYSLDTVIRIVHTLVLARQGGMLMHASSVIRDGKAYLFSGASGVGKTTISRLAPPEAHVLTDEISYVRRHEDGFRAHGTPFCGDLGRPGENLQAPLAGIYLLAQGQENRVDPLSGSEAVRGLMSNILFFAQDPKLVNAVFSSAIELAQRVPVRRLTFLPDASVWQLIGTK
jgi:hypothetical protein